MHVFLRQCGFAIACSAFAACAYAEQGDALFEAETLGLRDVADVRPLDRRPSACYEVSGGSGGISWFSFVASHCADEPKREYVACCGGPRRCVIRRK